MSMSLDITPSVMAHTVPNRNLLVRSDHINYSNMSMSLDITPSVMAHTVMVRIGHQQGIVFIIALSCLHLCTYDTPVIKNTVNATTLNLGYQPEYWCGSLQLLM